MRNCAHSNPKAGVVAEGAGEAQCSRGWTPMVTAKSANLNIKNFRNAHGNLWMISVQWIQMAMAILIPQNRRRPVAVCANNSKTGVVLVAAVAEVESTSYLCRTLKRVVASGD